MELPDLMNRFTFHPAREDQVGKYEYIREQAGDFAEELNRLCPDSRELSLAITKLEEVVFWANAGIARNS